MREKAGLPSDVDRVAAREDTEFPVDRGGMGLRSVPRDISDVGLTGDVDVTLFASAASGLLDETDLAEAASVLEPGCSAAVLVYENTWAAPFARALRRNGAQLVADGRIPVQALLAAAEALDAWPSTTALPPNPAQPVTKENNMPGLIRGVARTAAIAGTATAVSNRVSRRQAARWSQPREQVAPEPVYQEPAYQPAPAPAAPAPPAPAPPAPAAAATDRIAALKDLADLQAAGILSPEEFASEKARLLAS